VLVIAANRYDQVAKEMVSRWATLGAGLLTCVDLSLSGWQYPLSMTNKSMAVIGGQVVPVKEITGILTRLPCVFEQELTEIILDDRAYVAAEMTAFLLDWLSELKCPVLNQPTPTCLLGPYWRQERWVYTAAQIGIPIHAVHRRATLSTLTPSAPLDECSASVIVVGKHCFGAVDETLAAQARQLADVAQTNLLTVRFSHAQAGAAFISAEPWSNLDTDEVAQAILAYLQGRS
jgi:hypothetical protein